MPENIKIAVIRSQLEEDVFGSVPLIEHFLDKIFAFTQLKANRPFVCFTARITLNAQLHSCIVAYK